MHIRDDFDGSYNVALTGRVPNISDTGQAWGDLDVGNVAVPNSGELRTQGNGWVQAV